MAGKSAIEWTEATWNPVTGCLHNCPYCYARDIANRFYPQKFQPAIIPSRLKAPRNTPFPEAKAREWMGHRNVFVCSMADLFGRWVPTRWIEAVLAEVEAAPQWNFLFLTKFPQRMAEFDFPENAWMASSDSQSEIVEKWVCSPSSRRSRKTPRLPGVARMSAIPVSRWYSTYSSAREVGTVPRQMRAMGMQSVLPSQASEH